VPPCQYLEFSSASREYQSLSGCSDAIPLEQDGGVGTSCGHWDEDCFLDELMTGIATGSLPLSTITVGGLEDLGYTVDYGNADPYSTFDLNPACVCSNAKKNKPSVPQTKRPLSEKGLERAIEYGKVLLTKRRKMKKKYQGKSKDLVYLGDSVISILYREEGIIYSVEVKPDMF